MLNIENDKDKLKFLINHNNSLVELDEFFYEVENTEYSKYIIAVFNLYSSICLSKNKNILSYFQEILPFNILIPYFKNEKLSFEIRAVCCKIINVLYLEYNIKSDIVSTNLFFDIEKLKFRPSSQRKTLSDILLVRRTIKNFKGKFITINLFSNIIKN